MIVTMSKFLGFPMNFTPKFLMAEAKTNESFRR